MKCAQHVSLDAVGTCNGCGKGLCPECVSLFTPPLCGDCVTAHNAGVAKSLWLDLALMGVLFVAALVGLAGRVSTSDLILYTLMAAFFPPGWRFLSRYFSASGGYRSPLLRWVNLSAKAGAAAVLGIVIGPIQLYKAWRELKTVRATREMLSQR